MAIRAPADRKSAKKRADNTNRGVESRIYPVGLENFTKLSPVSRTSTLSFSLCLPWMLFLCPLRKHSSVFPRLILPLSVFYLKTIESCSIKAKLSV